MEAVLPPSQMVFLCCTGWRIDFNHTLKHRVRTELTKISALSLVLDTPLSSRVAMGSENLSQAVLLSSLTLSRVRQQNMQRKTATSRATVECFDDYAF